jgi:hypothetical protein
VNVDDRINEKNGLILVSINKQNDLFGQIDGGDFERAHGIFHHLLAVVFEAGFKNNDTSLSASIVADGPSLPHLNHWILPEGHTRHGGPCRYVRLITCHSCQAPDSGSLVSKFFLMMSYVDPHHPFAQQMDGLPKKPTLRGEVPAWPFQNVESDELLKEAANYYNCVRRLDAGVGMLMEKLKASGQDENTVIIFLGDHGPPFNRAKTTCYEAGLRVPFLVRWKGVTKAGLVSKAFVSSVDILPTILDTAGLAIPKHIQGRSLRSVAAGDDTGWRTTLAGEYHQHTGPPFFPRRALRDSRYQVIHNLLAGKLKISARVDGDTASEVVQKAAYDGTPARKAMELLANAGVGALRSAG